MGKLKGGLAAWVAKHGRPRLKNMKNMKSGSGKKSKPAKKGK